MLTGKRWEILILVGVMVIYTGLAFYKLTEYPPLGHDDLASAGPAYQLLTEGNIGRGYSVPWYVNHFLMFLSFKIFGIGVLQIKLGSVIMGAVLLLTTYFIGRKLFSTKVAAIAILFLVTDSAFFQTARWGRSDIVAVTFFMLSLYLFLQARDRSSNLMFSLSAIALGASVFSHENGLFLGIPIMYLLLLLDYKKTFFKQKLFWIFSSTLLLVAVPYILYIAPDFSNYKDQVLFFISRTGESVGGFVFYHEQPSALFMGEITERWRGYIAQNSLVVGLFVLAVVNGLMKRDKSSKLILVAVISMQVLFILIKKNGFYLVWMTPLLFILVSSLFVDIFNYLRTDSQGRFIKFLKGNRFAALTATFLIFVILFSASSRIVGATLLSDSYDSIGSQLNISVPADAKVLGPGPFWLALRDRDYRGYGSAFNYAVEKRDNIPGFSLEQAILEVLEDFKPDYVLYQEKDLPHTLPIRLALKDFLTDSPSIKETLIVGGNYYGEVEVWKVNWSEEDDN